MPSNTFCVCGFEIPFAAVACAGCQKPCGFPNVRAAEAADEVAALDKRCEDAVTLAQTQKCEAETAAFAAALGQSVAVIARDIGSIVSLYSSGQSLAPFHAQVRAGSRIPQDNEWDKGRTSAESLIHPLYHENISYGALSIDGVGAEGWGGFSLTLGEIYVADRASVFEENVVLFCRNRVTTGRPAPCGYRAPWAARPRLAIAKLQPKIKTGMTLTDFSGLLLEQNTGRGDADFIEVHIYGPIHPKSVVRVTARQPKLQEDRLMWRGVKKKIADLGIAVVEVP